MLCENLLCFLFVPSLSSWASDADARCSKCRKSEPFKTNGAISSSISQASGSSFSSGSSAPFAIVLMRTDVISCRECSDTMPVVMYSSHARVNEPTFCMVGPLTGAVFDCNRLRLASGMTDSRCERVSPNAARCGISGECCDNDQGLKKS